MDQLASDEVSLDQVFASAHYYFPILICSRKEKPRKAGNPDNLAVQPVGSLTQIARLPTAVQILS